MILEQISATDLIVDEVYGGSRKGNSSDDPLPTLLGVDNSAGFRHLGKRPEVSTLRLLALKSSFADPNWPDSLDREKGLLVYYGDNHKVRDLHDTPRQGNLILRNLFDEAHRSRVSSHFPPIFIFGNTGVYRDVRFLGLAVPGADGMSSDEDLVAVWRTTPERLRFQNYKAIFSLLDVARIPRAWIEDIKSGDATGSAHAPRPWLDWVNSRRYRVLKSAPILTIRNRRQQLPEGELVQYIQLILSRYCDNPFAFERCAMAIAKLFLPDIHSEDMTRPWRDGGRDAIGLYRIGKQAGSIDVEFALEAKCYDPAHSVGVRETSRLISRLRHRQFGILVTTSYLHDQAYSEVIEDRHPVVIIVAQDIAAKLKERFVTPSLVEAWLDTIDRAAECRKVSDQND